MTSSDDRRDSSTEFRGHFLAELTTTRLEDLLAAARPVVVLLPVGSVEPHGPHLPLGTDTLISSAVILRAVPTLAARVVPIIAPAVSYGVTDYARGFAGAISVAAPILSGYIRAIVDGLLADRVAHVCIVNNHLEPEHDAAVKRATDGLARKQATIVCPLDRRLGRTLSEEFKRGECHAGRYETSLVLAYDRDQVDEAARGRLDEVPISLSKQIADGKTDFRSMGLARAYAGAPREASVAEGEELVDKLAAFLAAEIFDAMEMR